MPAHPLPVAPEGLWDRADMADALRRRDMTAVLALFRKWTGATQSQLARMVGISQGYVSEILAGKRQVTSLDMFERFVTGLGIPPARFGFAAESDPDRRAVLAAAAALPLIAADEEIEEVVRRVQRLAASNVSEDTLTQAEEMVEAVGRQYEASNASTAYPAALRQRRWVDELMSGRQRPREQAQLYTLGGKLSGLLGYLAFDAGNKRLARVYCDEAFTLARAAGDRDLAAWVRGTQSFIAYYGGDYRQALDLAHDGQRHARGGPQSIRLAISGEARALGKLGDRPGVDDAVDRALAARDQIDETDPVCCAAVKMPMKAALMMPTGSPANRTTSSARCRAASASCRGNAREIPRDVVIRGGRVYGPVFGQAGTGNCLGGSAGRERGEQAASGQDVDPRPRIGLLVGEAAADGQRGGAERVQGERERVGAFAGR